MGSILLVETDPDTGDRVATALRAAGHEVLVTFTVSDAYLRLSEGGIDAVVIDSFDPRIGVIDLGRSMESLPDTPPIVLVSSSPYAPEISARIGAAAFVPKPLDAAELVTVIARLAGEVRPVRVIDGLDGDDEPTGPARQYG
ncbi:MAG TPA: response regulator [Kofleriaceae bacterium]|nr:response regulator [Kofleriaceae bacterium]